MRHRLQQKVFDRKKYNTDKRVIPSSIQEPRTPSTFTIKQPLSRKPHSARKTLHSKSTYFYRWGSSHKLSSSLSYVVPGVCALALLVGGFVAINPVVKDKTYANNNGIMTTVVGNPAIGLNITGAENGTATNVTAAGNVTYRENIITITGNNISHYRLTLNTPSGSTGNLAGRKNPYAIIGKVPTNTLPADFSENTWGYAISNDINAVNSELSYYPVSSGDERTNTGYLAIKFGSPAPSGDKYKIVFAAKIGDDMPADHYETNVYISAVANAEAVIGFLDKNNNLITTMQEMTTAFCSNVDSGVIGRLKDIRDSKIYWVGKLADNECWMTQNLDYDGGGTQVNSIGEWTSTDNTIKYYDPGNYYYANGRTQTKINTTTSIQNLHYSIGNYYSSVAAASACPDNWRLPTGYNGEELTGLLRSYGWSSSNAASANIGNNGINGDPLFFVYGGNIYSGQRSGVGNSGYYWSGTNASDAPKTFHLFFSSNAKPSEAQYRYYGMSVRCIAK